MKGLGIKATFYDLAAYVLPGIIFVGLMKVYWKLDIQNIILILTTTKSGFVYWALTVVASYYLGLCISIISSYSIEKLYNLHIGDLNVLFEENEWMEFKEKFLERFNFEYRRNNFMAAVTWVSQNMEKSYETAFIFLCFYGMARNIAFISIIGILSSSFVSCWSSVQSAFAVIGILSFFIYRKFWRYFHQYIVWSFSSNISIETPRAIEE